jgi:hypothetical protein
MWMDIVALQTGGGPWSSVENGRPNVAAARRRRFVIECQSVACGVTCDAKPNPQTGNR